MDNLLNLSEAARLLPTTNGKRMPTMTLWRWCSKGAVGHRLRHFHFGKRIAITIPDLLAFGEANAQAHAATSAEGKTTARCKSAFVLTNIKTQIVIAEVRLPARGMMKEVEGTS